MTKYAKTSGEWVYEYMDYNLTKPRIIFCQSRKDAVNKAYEWLFADQNREAFNESTIGVDVRATLETSNHWESDPNGCKVTVRLATKEECKARKREQN